MRSPVEGAEGPIQLVEALRGTVPALEFNRVDAGAFGPDGTIWIFDGAGRNGATIHVLDSLGLTSVPAGREGEGPGEYRAPLRIFRLADGTMLVKEMSTTRAVRFSADGTVLATISLPPKVATGWVVTPDTTGGWYITVSFEDNKPERIGRFGWLHFDHLGNVIDTVLPPVHMLSEPTPDGIAPGRIRTVGRDGSVLTTVPGPNRLTRYEVDHSVLVMEWPGMPPEYGAAERVDMQVVEDRMSELLGKAKLPLPTHKQPANRILTDHSGNVWAQLSNAGERIPDEELTKGQGPLTVRWREPDRWAAFRRDGTLRFVVNLPPKARLLDREGERLLGVIADDTGVEQVVVWRISSGGVH
ncbi:MAG: hypothetical protein IT353_03820 [Gemmatimonadaceae bacterium]|nr:hypothetical protein [Gemmatimonadaceae bacterium]